jgi:hypothetical protein
MGSIRSRSLFSLKGFGVLNYSRVLQCFPIPNKEILIHRLEEASRDFFPDGIKFGDFN